MDASRRSPAWTGRGVRLGFALTVVPMLTGAGYRTPNFVVEAPTPQVARQVGDHAEACRKAVALAWLGRELPNWSRPCPIRVKLTGGEAGGMTTFSFGGGRVTDQEMTVEGRLDRILSSALPHEVTHTIFAAFFGGPMPRWADEGASLLSEDQVERDRHDGFVASLVQRRGQLPLSRLFQQEEYPEDLMGFYGQGYSVSKFLVEHWGRPRFLKFVKDGMEIGWDKSVRAHYGLANCRELDRAWRSWYVVADRTRPADDPGPATLLVRSRQEGNRDFVATASGRLVLRAQSAEESATR